MYLKASHFFSTMARTTIHIVRSPSLTAFITHLWKCKPKTHEKLFFIHFRQLPGFCKLLHKLLHNSGSGMNYTWVNWFFFSDALCPRHVKPTSLLEHNKTEKCGRECFTSRFWLERKRKLFKTDGRDLIFFCVLDVCRVINPCKNGATCQPNGDGQTCQCTPNFQGEHCDKGKHCPI